MPSPLQQVVEQPEVSEQQAQAAEIAPPLSQAFLRSLGVVPDSHQPQDMPSAKVWLGHKENQEDEQQQQQQQLKQQRKLHQPHMEVLEQQRPEPEPLPDEGSVPHQLHRPAQQPESCPVTMPLFSSSFGVAFQNFGSAKLVENTIGSAKIVGTVEDMGLGAPEVLTASVHSRSSASDAGGAEELISRQDFQPISMPQSPGPKQASGSKRTPPAEQEAPPHEDPDGSAVAWVLMRPYG